MKIKEAEFHSCPTCSSRKRVSEEEYGCDVCKKPINNRELDPKGNRMYLQAQVFSNRGNSSAEQMEFCSWKCALKGLSKVKTDYFVSMPYLHYDETQKGIRASDFWAAVRSFGKRK
jgi:hypothetical protein